MRCVFLLCALVLTASQVALGDYSDFRLAIDFEERPSPDLSMIDNTYHGGTRYVYAFLVVRGTESDRVDRSVSAYDIGYRLISPDESVLNHGFHGVDDWAALEVTESEFPSDLASPGSPLPAVLGYWKLELTKGMKSRAEFQLVPNSNNSRSRVALVEGSGHAVALPTLEFSQDVTAHGLINLEFCHHEPYLLEDEGYRSGEVIARFMPGVIDMEGRFGNMDDISDPGLKQVAEIYGLTAIRRLYRNAEKNPTPVLSRTGRIYTPLRKWDDYVLSLSTEFDPSVILDSILALPRCIYAEPNLILEPTAMHVPNDELAADTLSWHLYRINMPEAWDLEIGSRDVHVGVVDGGVDYHLDDFGGGMGSAFKMVGGYDYAMDDADPRVEFGDDCEPPDPISNHGNHMQSVLGALTNNDSLGVAGVAGGWGGYGGELGPSIYHFKIRTDARGDTCGVYSVSYLAEAITDAYSTYGCQVLSVSVTGDYSETLLKDICDFHNSGGVVVATTGNGDTEARHYPGYYRNDWILCVQGSSRHPLDGNDTTLERRVSSQDTLYSWGADWPADYWPVPRLSIDACAPASHMCLIYADSLLGYEPYYYTSGNGVSYAPPQVAGVVALMLSKNNTLEVCDIEGLIGASCTDITSDDTDGYELEGSLPRWDKFTGWGRINADSAVMFADPDHPCEFSVQHFSVSGGGVIVDSTTGFENVYFRGGDPLSDNFYKVKRYEVRRTVTPPAGYKFAWGRSCSGAGWAWSGNTPYLDRYNFQEPYCGMDPTTQYSGTITLFSYIYAVKLWNDDYLGVYPDSVHYLDWSYGVLTEGMTTSVDKSAGQETADQLRVLAVAPNPSKGGLLISFQMPTSGQVALKIYDIRGREVRTVIDEALEAGIHERQWNGRNNSGRPVAPGVYLCRVSTARQFDIEKVLLVRGGGE